MSYGTLDAQRRYDNQTRRQVKLAMLELDEMWLFVLKKTNKRWVWLSLCRRTRQIVAYFIGDRSQTGCLQLWRRIPRAYRRCYSFSDCWEAYQHIFYR